MTHTALGKQICLQIMEQLCRSNVCKLYLISWCSRSRPSSWALWLLLLVASCWRWTRCLRSSEGCSFSSKHHQILLDIHPPRLLGRHKVELGIVNVQVGVLHQLHARVDVLEHPGIGHSHCYQHSWIDHCLNTVHWMSEEVGKGWGSSGDGNNKAVLGSSAL